MIIFKHTWQWLLEPSPYTGQVKTQTRRLAQGDCKYFVGQIHAALPNRGIKQIAKIRILEIRKEDVRHISKPDLLAEGFSNPLDFLKTWVNMHDKTFERDSAKFNDGNMPFVDFLMARPKERYTAWVLTFEVVE